MSFPASVISSPGSKEKFYIGLNESSDHSLFLATFFDNNEGPHPLPSRNGRAFLSSCGNYLEIKVPILQYEESNGYRYVLDRSGKVKYGLKASLKFNNSPSSEGVQSSVESTYVSAVIYSEDEMYNMSKMIHGLSSMSTFEKEEKLKNYYDYRRSAGTKHYAKILSGFDLLREAGFDVHCRDTSSPEITL